MDEEVVAPELSVLVVAYRNPELTVRCLKSVVAETTEMSFELIVVDNASGDGTAAAIREAFPEIELIESAENLGFARGMNLAAGRARGEYLVLLNPDTRVQDRALERLVEFARARPDHGLYGGRNLAPDGHVDPRSCWGAPSLWSSFTFASGLSTAFSRSRLFDPESLGGWQRDTVREVDVVTGSLLLVSRIVWDQLGGFDPVYWMYGEDVDLSIRARDLGYRPVITPSATITHVVGASTDDDQWKTTMVLCGRVTVIRRNWTSVRARLGVALITAGVALRAGLGRVLGRAENWQGAWAERDEWLRGYPS